MSWLDDELVLFVPNRLVPPKMAASRGATGGVDLEAG
jgi:hypothetical protein